MLKIQALQKQKIEVTYAHFETLKSLLKAEQTENFDTHVEKAMKCILAKASEDQAPLQEQRICTKEQSDCNKKG